MKKSWMIYALILISTNGRAQFEDNDFPPPPPPPPPPPGGFSGPSNSIGSPESRGSGGSVGAAGAGSFLPKDKREKLAQASGDEINDKNYPELIDSFDYNNAEITDVIKAISELTGKNFIIDPGVRGKITIIAPTKITVAEAYKAFLSALAINGYTVVPSNGFFKIKSSRNAQRDNIETYSGNYFPNSDQMITRIIHLKHISAEQVSRELRILNSKDGEVTPFNSTNSIILSDYGSNVERVMKIIGQLDVPGFEEKLHVLRINNAKAKDMAELINKIVNKDSSSKGGGGSFSAGVPRFGGSSSGRTTQGQSGSAYFMVIPDDRTNSLIIVGNTQGIERVKKLVAQLDFKIKADDNGGVYVYYVKNGEAEKIAQTLSGIAKDSKPSSSGSGLGGPGSFIPPAQQAQSIFGGDVKVTADKDTNSLIITASKQDYEVVLNLLSKVDIPRDQVYVETVILEMLINDAADWGLGYYQFDKTSGGVGRQGFNGNLDLQTLLNPIAGTGAILSFGNNDVFELKTPTGQTQKISSFVGFLNFLKSTGRTNVLSTPQIMALDNEDSEIEVGQEVAVSLTQSQSGTGPSQTTANFKDATIKLKIKPFISPASDTVRMKIIQNIAQPEAQGQIPNTLTLSKRSITTNIVVPDGDTAVLGGLVKDSERERVTKVPILGDIPILGWLFKSRKMEKEKTNLIVFITPKIIRTQGENHKLVDKKLDERLNFIKQNGGRDPYGKKIDELPRQARGLKPNVSNSDVSKPVQSEEEPPIEPSENDTELNLTPEEQDGRTVE